MKCPCKGCPDRTITCHGVCKKYQEWRKNLDETNAWLRSQIPHANVGAVKSRNRRIRDKARGWGGKRGGKHYE